MSVRVMAHVFELEHKDLTPQDKFVLLAYVDHADDDGGNIFPAINRIAKKTGYSSRTVQRRTRRLVELGLLVPDGNVYLEGTRGTGLNKWRYNWDWTPTERASECHPKPAERVTSGTKRVTSETKKGDTAMSPEPSLEPSPQPSLILEPKTAGSQWLFSEILKIVTEHNASNPKRKRRAARRFQNCKQKELVEQAERRLGLPEFQRAANYYFAKGITGIGDLSARIGNWSGNSRNCRSARGQPTPDPHRVREMLHEMLDAQEGGYG